ncbi:unnamed protein product [Rhizophagus irregularis]|uniref:Uncharacterized protein n=1 Tax=Rhizophagus irregularis TaxID=588596 RepID=A0A2I1FTZ2_9GLOM|nr:hypothetical protein RhiirA4_536785 [Rhizophagus irregularis]CAB4417106.1 unnamed protein product [Rhizophagus irregularis]
MASLLSYSQVVRMSPGELKKLKEREKELKEREKVKEFEKELYSRECVAQSINFVVGKANKELPTLIDREIFSCYLATILARDKEVFAVWLRILQGRCEIYLSKNSDWLDKDNKYIENITKYLKDISKNAPVTSEDNERDFLEAVTIYCSTKLKSRLKKLEDDIKFYGDNEHVKSFSDFLSAMIGNAENTNIITISGICKEYYKKVKKAKIESRIPSEFLRHIKKVSSYMASAIGIVECARNIQYKSLFSNVQVYRVKPVIIKNQPIYSWENIIRRFIDEDRYKRFMDRCSKKSKIMERISKVYTDKATQKQQPLDGDNVKQCIYLHAEMNILASLIIDKKIKRRVFIAVSKRCCFLCELYINFAQLYHGYNIIVSEPQFFTKYDFDWKNTKICSRWKFPHVRDNKFMAGSLNYILKNLNQIIEQKLEHYTSNLPADSSDGQYIYGYTKGFSSNPDNNFNLFS